MTWGDDAACRRSPRPDAFFEVEEAADEGRAPDPALIRYALDTCRSCPVRDACIERAGPKDSGIWGGSFAVDRGLEYGSAKWWQEYGVWDLLRALR